MVGSGGTSGGGAFFTRAVTVVLGGHAGSNSFVAGLHFVELLSMASSDLLLGVDQDCSGRGLMGGRRIGIRSQPLRWRILCSSRPAGEIPGGFPEPVVVSIAPTTVKARPS